MTLATRRHLPVKPSGSLVTQSFSARHAEPGGARRAPTRASAETKAAADRSSRGAPRLLLAADGLRSPTDAARVADAEDDHLRRRATGDHSSPRHAQALGVERGDGEHREITALENSRA